MTIRIVSQEGDPNKKYAEKLSVHLTTINPALAQREDIKVAIVTSFSGIGYPSTTTLKEADLLLIYENCGEERKQDWGFFNINQFSF